jgi:hypothetical protein
VYHVATSDEYNETRRWINEQAELLDERGRDRLASKIRDPKSFIDAFHELCVAAKLRLPRGYVTYEPDVGGVTPDLLIDAAPAPPLVVEVWTRHRADTAARAHRQWLALQARLESIPVAVRLLVVEGPREHPAPSDSRLVREVVRNVRDWLMSPVTQGRSVHATHGYTFAIVGQAAGPRVEFAAPGSAGGAVTADMLLAAIANKVDRYREAVDRIEAELLVVIAADDGSGLSKDVLADTLGGHNVTSLSFSVFDVGPMEVGKVKLRDNDDPPKLDRRLSAVAWLDVDDRTPPGSLTFFPNPDSVRPLREGLGL